jgi:hypothetical protein
VQEEQKTARPWRLVAAEVSEEMDSQRLLTLLEELNHALEQQGMVKPGVGSRRGKLE